MTVQENQGIRIGSELAVSMDASTDFYREKNTDIQATQLLNVFLLQFFVIYSEPHEMQRRKQGLQKKQACNNFE